MSNPELIQQMIMSNPQMQQLVEVGVRKYVKTIFKHISDLKNGNFFPF